MVVGEKTQSLSRSRKIFTCSEIEATSLKKNAVTSPRSFPTVPNIKHFDPAVMHYSLKSSLTRYQRVELMALKESKSSQSPPLCQNDPKIIRLNILKNEPNHQEASGDQLKALSDELPNLPMSSIDSKIMDVLKSYQILKPQSNNDNDVQQKSTQNNDQNNGRHISWRDEKNVLEGQQHENNSTKSFFDKIASTTKMFTSPRLGNFSNNCTKNRQPLTSHQQPARSFKGNSCSNEHKTFYGNNASTGSASNETVSSNDESIGKSNENFDGFEKRKMAIKKSQREEPLPEWFSFPASRNDVIDLHGFEDEVSMYPKTFPSTNGSDRNTSYNSSNSNMVFDNFFGYNKKLEDFNKPLNNLRSNQSQSNRYTSGDGYPRYRNPLHRSSFSSSFNSSDNRLDFKNFHETSSFNDGDGPGISPFFEQWKQKHVPQENINFLNCMSSAGSMMTISDVEETLKRNRNPFGQLFQKQQQHHQYGHQSFPQFLQNSSDFARFANGGGSYNPFSAAPSNIPIQNTFIPTQEQLQQHTSEIMRNAILRKQVNNGRKFPK